MSLIIVCFLTSFTKSDPRTWSPRTVFNYYKRNLQRFTHLVRTGELDKIFRPGRFSPYPVNNIEKLLDFGADHFGSFANKTKQRSVIVIVYVYPTHHSIYIGTYATLGF